MRVYSEQLIKPHVGNIIIYRKYLYIYNLYVYEYVCVLNNGIAHVEGS